MIIIATARNNNRFTEIQKRVNGISVRVVPSELKELDMNCFIVKKVSVGYPVSIAYELLPFCQILEKVVSSLTPNGEFNIKQKLKLHFHDLHNPFGLFKIFYRNDPYVGFPVLVQVKTKLFSFHQPKNFEEVSVAQA